MVQTLNRSWPKEGPSRVPYWVYKDPEVYEAEQARIFRGPTWNYVGLEAELPEAGDFKRSFVGDKSVLAVRDEDGAVNVMLNRCAHHGSYISRDWLGNCAALTCPYHQWTYDLKGRLTGVPFRRGVKGQGGMPDDFRLEDHGLHSLKVEVVNGAIFASFDDTVPAFADYLGPDMLYLFSRVFNGRKLRILGYQRQIIGSNWKLMMENIKDPYHASLLHVFLLSFGLFRVDQKSACFMDETKGHAALTTRRAEVGDDSGTSDMASYDPDYKLEDPRLIEPRKEFADDITLAMTTIYPSLIVQQQSNTLAMRHLIPRGPDQFELAWTFFGYEDDDDEMRTLRLRQANLMGAAGLVSIDDTEMMEFSQAGIRSALPGDAAVMELGGRDADAVDHLVTESMIRGFYVRYRNDMGFA